MGVAYGGTGLSSIAANSMLYASASNTLSQLVSVTNGILRTSSGVPSYLSPTTRSVLIGTPTISWLSFTAGSAAKPQTIIHDGTTVSVAQLVISNLNDVSFTSLSTNHLLRYNGTNWVNVAYSALPYLNTDGSNSMAANLNMGAFKIVSLATPTAASDATTKFYVDNIVSAINYNGYCDYGTTANIIGSYNNGVSGVGATITATSVGALVVDGVTVSLNDRVLVKN